MSAPKRLSLNADRLILTFDAFGTLYRPRSPLHQMYTAVLESHRLRGVSEPFIKRRLSQAFKVAHERYPYYGKRNGMTTEEWWAEVTRSTLNPQVSTVQNRQSVLDAVIQDVWEVFDSEQGWQLYDDVRPFFNHLQQLKNQPFLPKITVGVVTNSDDRVPSILSSLKLSVHPRRHLDGRDVHKWEEEKEYDINFVAMSYDVECSKPEPEIFEAAKQLGGGTSSERVQYIHVGDNIDEDVRGAERAGWQGILLSDADARHRHREPPAEGEDALSSTDAMKHIEAVNETIAEPPQHGTEGQTRANVPGVLQIDNLVELRKLILDAGRAR